MYCWILFSIKKHSDEILVWAAWTSMIDFAIHKLYPQLRKFAKLKMHLNDNKTSYYAIN